MDIFHFFIIVAGLYMLFQAYLGIRTEEIRTRFFSWIWSGETWHKDEEPIMYRIAIIFYVVGGFAILIVATLSMLNIIKLN